MGCWGSRVVNGISPTDEWTNRKGEPGVRAILENVH